MKKRWNRFIRWIVGDWWVIRTTTSKEYLTYNSYKDIVRDTGLTKQQAKEMCCLLNQ